MGLIDVNCPMCVEMRDNFLFQPRGVREFSFYAHDKRALYGSLHFVWRDGISGVTTGIHGYIYSARQ